MKYMLLCALLPVLTISMAGAQQRDSIFHRRVDDRVEAMMQHFTTQVSPDSGLVDTVAYIQRLLARHVETMRWRTTDERHLSRMYAYALMLRDERFEKVLPEAVRERYSASFEGISSGFSFCPLCRYHRPPEAGRCGNCGELSR